MNSKVYKYFGVFLILIPCILIVYSLISAININSKAYSANAAVSFYALIIQFLLGISTWFIPIILGIISGIFYYKFGNQNKKDRGLLKIAFIFHLIAALIIILILSIIILTMLTSNSYMGDLGAFGFAILLSYLIYPASFIFCVGSLLQLIDWIKNRNK